MNQDNDPITLGLVRNTQPYNIEEYQFTSNANKNTETNSIITNTKGSSVTRIDIVTAGKDYNVGDPLVFDNKDTEGFGAVGKVCLLYNLTLPTNSSV